MIHSVFVTLHYFRTTVIKETYAAPHICKYIHTYARVSAHTYTPADEHRWSPCSQLRMKIEWRMKDISGTVIRTNHVSVQVRSTYGQSNSIHDSL